MRQALRALRRAFGGRGVLTPALLGLLLLPIPSPAGAQESKGPAKARAAGVWVAGAYSFSDKRGGFRITGASGLGTRNDPVVPTQQFLSASPVTLVIRAVGPVRPFGREGVTPNGLINLRLLTVNGSGVPWIEFEFELQEMPGVPCTFGDGLSFDQRDTGDDSVGSDSFRRFSRDFEPADRLLFREGKVDPGAVSAFGFLVTDFTPRATFYLVEDPRIPFSRGGETLVFQGRNRQIGAMSSTLDEDRRGQLLSLFSFYKEAGVDDAVASAPIDRFAPAAPPAEQAGTPAVSRPMADAATQVPEKQQKQPLKAARQPPAAREAPKPAVPDDAQAALAREEAAKAGSLEELRAAMNAFNGCNLKYTAKQAVFADGDPEAALMLVGEAPGRDEDIEGLPFVGRSGKLLDRMLAAIGIDRSSAYLANVLPWRPPGNRTPTPQETEICRPFIERQIELADPKVLVALGGSSAKVLLRSADGILRLRGNWRVYRTSEGKEIPIMPTLHPAYLLRNGAQKKLAWRDFLEIKARLKAL